MQRITCLPRYDMHKIFNTLDFSFALSENDLYWREDVYYQFTLKQIEKDIEAPSAELHHMCLDFCATAVNSQEILESMGIAPHLWPVIKYSWDKREPALYSRFDLAYTGNGSAKMLEYNADTPTSIYESAVLQWEWMTTQQSRGNLPYSCDQYNSLHEQLVQRFKLMPGKLWHFACMDNKEDRATIEYLADCATQGGKDIVCLLMEQIGASKFADDQNYDIFVDNQNKMIQNLFKLYPWEWLVKEDFAKHSAAMNNTRWHEPAWKMLLSNKALLVHLWKRHPNHPNLLETYFYDTLSFPRSGVVKPILGREGANVQITDGHGMDCKEDGPYLNQRLIWQALADTKCDKHYTTIGSWIIGDRPSGMCVRESINPIINNTSQFIPHIING